MSIWKRLTGRKSFLSSARKNNDRPPGDFNQAVGNVDQSDKNQPLLLPGEKLVSQANRVIYNDPYSCRDEEEIGDLYVTNFRVIFQSYSKQGVQTNGTKAPQRNKLIGNNDIALYNIDSIYTIKKKKKKLLLVGLIPRQVKQVEIHCKDFRIYIFQFANERQEAFLILNDIVSGAFPSWMHSMFAFQYGGDTSGDELPRFNSEQDWRELLQQKGAIGHFKVTQCNADFRVSDSLPECFVVPNSLSESEIIDIMKKFSNNRCPVWSYTHHTGASLIRMAYCIPGIGEELENKMVDHVRNSHPSRNSDSVQVLDLARKLPSLAEIQTSFELLRRLCIPVSMKEFWLSDATWNSSLDSCRWLAIISSCLSTACEVAESLVKSKTVILKEPEAVDLAPLISCLVQLILDPETRTIESFQMLLEREWVALGHKFSERYGNSRDVKGGVRSAVFPLFLDCVWQLIHQFPSQFQFTEYYLVSIWDSVCLGLFRNFLFDSARKSRLVPPKLSAEEVYIRRSESVPLLSSWDWEKQLSEDQISLFYSPQYVFAHENSLRVPLPHISTSLDGSSLLHGKKSEPDEVTLSPKVEVPHLLLWSLCYMRWLPPAEIMSGGPASEYLSQCILVEEVFYLRQLITSLESVAEETRRSQRRRSRLIFSSDSNQSFIRSPRSLCVSSSFPYSTGQPLDGRFGAGSFIDSYFKNSVLYKNNSAVDEMDD